MNLVRQWIALWALALSLTIGACATRPGPFEYKPYNELKPGPGIVTGEKGAYTIYSKPDSITEDPAAGPEGASAEDPSEPDSP